MSEVAQLVLDGKTFDFPIVVGSEGEKAIDIRSLRGTTGYITLDNGFMNTGACESRITFIDGEKGILRYQGIPLDQLASHSTFLETSYLLVHGRLPSQAELDAFIREVQESSLLHEDLAGIIRALPANAHPMAVLGSMVNALACYYPQVDPKSSPEEIAVAATRLIGVSTTLAAFAYKRSIGEPFVYPAENLSYSENFLHMMFSSPVRKCALDADMVRALDMLLIMHADHEQNCSASSVRLVGSSQPNLYAVIAAGIAALWGPLHGGANQAVMEMLAQIHESGEEPESFIAKAKDKSTGFKLSGFGHRVYKNYDPRARIIKGVCTDILKKGSARDPLLNIALRLEEMVLQDDYFSKRKLYPNVDFYSGLLYKAMGIPTDMFTVLFVIGRIPGWIAQWLEMINTPGVKIGRPRQVYIGNRQTDYVPVAKR